MNNVKCKTENMAVRDYCLVWGCPGLAILTISLFVSLKVGNDFGQDNFAKFVTFVISSGLLGTVYYLFQSVLAEVPLRLQERQCSAAILPTNQEAEAVTEDSTDNMSFEQVHECLAEVLPQTESAHEPLSEELIEPTVEVSDSAEPTKEATDTIETSSEQPDLYAQRCKEYQREQNRVPSADVRESIQPGYRLIHTLLQSAIGRNHVRSGAAPQTRYRKVFAA